MQLFRHRLLLTGLVILLSRLPFLFDGFGAEEDAWALPLVAERIGETGIYEVSRLPGHPVQEITYSMMYDATPVMYNLLTALISTAGLLAFALMLRNFGHSQPLLTTLAVAFTPIVWINSTNDLDYTWAMGFILASGFFISRRFPLMAGLFTGLAIGCRITSGAMLLPYAVLIWYTQSTDTRKRQLLLYLLSALTAAAVCFLPVYIQYGTSFFTYYEHFPIPGFAKNFYKGVLGVWGTPGSIAILAGILLMILQQNKSAQTAMDIRIRTGLHHASVFVVLLYTISFIRLPLKSAFMIPLVPFMILLFSLLLSRPQLRAITVTLFLSGLFFGINLAEANRGSGYSKLALVKNISGQQVAFDPLNGLVLADRSKRKQRTAFAQQVLSTTKNLHEKTYIITGWWLADLLYLTKDHAHGDILYRYYTDEQELKWYKAQGYKIYYLEDQDELNDLRFQKTFTRQYAQPLQVR